MTQPPNPQWDPRAAGGGQGPAPQSPPPGYGSGGPGYQQPGYQQPGYQQGYQQQQGYQPGPGGYPQAPGYPPGPAAPPTGYPTSDDKTWALIAHFGGAVGAFFAGVLAFVGPLVAFLVKGNSSPTVRAHAVAALNFQIPVSGVALIAIIARVCAGVLPSGLDLLVVLLFTLVSIAAWLVGVIFGIIAGVKANDGTLYKYPFGMKIVK